MRADYSACWANYRCDCDRGMSKEHLLSKALFPDQLVYVSGFAWCEGTEKRVGINSLQRKFLCAKHNNDLSQTDQAAVLAISAFTTGKGTPPVMGLLLERWLLKTAINLSVGSNLHIGSGMADSKTGWPSPYLLAVAFGDLLFSACMGAYFLLPQQPYSHRAGEFLVTPIYRDGAIGGFVFGLRGQFVFLSLYPGHVPPAIGLLAPSLLPEPLGTATLVYRPHSLLLQIGSSAPINVQLEWATK